MQLNHIHPLRQNRNGAKIKSTPTLPISYSNTRIYQQQRPHKPDRPHNQRTIHDQQHISEKSVLHSFQTSRHRKRHSHSLPRYNRLYNNRPDHHRPENHISHSRQEPYNVIMSERITAQVPESNIVNQSTHTTTAQHTTQQIQTIFPFW